MKLRRLKVEGYKNIRSCDIEFTQGQLINAVIGSNGSGKSNLIEAIVQILIGFYFEKPPSFSFRFEFEAQNRSVVLQGESGSASVMIDGERMTLDHFAKRLRDGPAQVFYPELTLVYYSGECQRLQRSIARYQRQFRKVVRNPATDRFRPLFLQSSNEQSQLILLALFAHGHRELIARLKLSEIIDVRIVLRSPEGFDPERHEPKLWNTEGAIRRIVAALDETADRQETRRIPKVTQEHEVRNELNRNKEAWTEERIYHFSESKPGGICEFARRLASGSENVYLALDSLKTRSILRSVSFQLRGHNTRDAFPFEQLSEGEKQLLAVIGAITLTNQKDNLVLLDEPDTHLNPHWSWDYQSMLTETFKPEQRPHSTVLMATHDPVMISGMLREQVLIAHTPEQNQQSFSHPHRHPRGQGVANLLCSSEFFGLPSSLDKETQKLLDQRLAISIKHELSPEDKENLRTLNSQLEILPGVSERDPSYVAFLQQRHPRNATE